MKRFVLFLTLILLTQALSAPEPTCYITTTSTSTTTSTTSTTTSTTITSTTTLLKWTEYAVEAYLLHDYEFGEWDCTNMSNYVLNLLWEKDNITTYCVSGYYMPDTYEKDSLHNWLAIKYKNETIILDPAMYPFAQEIPREFYEENYESVRFSNESCHEWIPYKEEWL